MSSTTSNTEEINHFYDFIFPLAIKAGEILLEGYHLHQNQKDIKLKDEYYDMVTKYDIKIEQFLQNEILKIYPTHKFIGEEETAANNNQISKLTNEPTWIIDPIDGTSNFIKNLPHTCISIALAINQEIVIGIVNNPILNELYTAKKGQGAFLNGKPIKVSDCKNIRSANIAYEISLIHEPKIRFKNIKRVYKLGSNATRTLSFSSVVISLCYVARGSIDAYVIEDMYPWDVAAGSLLITEAGGYISNINGDKFDLMKVSLICGSKKELCTEIIKLVHEADQIKCLNE